MHYRQRLEELSFTNFYVKLMPVVKLKLKDKVLKKNYGIHVMPSIYLAYYLSYTPGLAQPVDLSMPIRALEI